MEIGHQPAAGRVVEEPNKETQNWTDRRKPDWFKKTTKS